MRLTELEPEWIRLTETRGTYRRCERAEAQGILFLCPVCFQRNNGPVGTHAVICWSRSAGVPDEVEPGPGRWRLDGSSWEDLSLEGDAPGGGGARSVQLRADQVCAAHFHVTLGAIELC